MTLEDSGCRRFDDAIVELALGTISGRERADVLAHLESCRACETKLESLSQAGDRLLDVVPVAEPPVGFEVRVLEGIETATRARSSRTRRRVALLGLAAVAIAVVGFTAGALSSNRSPSPPRHATAHGALISHGHTVGELSVRSGNPARLTVRITGLKRSGPVVCRVVERTGRSITLGIFWLYDGKGSWDVTMPFPANELRFATITTEGGAPVARGKIG